MRIRRILASSLALSLCAVLVATLAFPTSALAQRNRGGGGGNRGAGGGGVKKGAKPAPSFSPLPVGPYVPRKGVERSVRYEIYDGKDKPMKVLVLRGDGAVRYKEGDNAARSAQIPRNLVKRFFQLARQSGFRSLESIYGERSLTPDPHSKTLTWKIASGVRTVQVFEDPDKPAPAAFTQVSEKLDHLMKRLSKVPPAKIPFSGIGVTVQTDRTAYPVVTEGPAPILWAAISINNSADEPLRVEFPEGKRYDFAIKNAAGEEVYHWTPSRTASTSPATLNLRKDAVTFTEGLPLVAASGDPLPAGDYLLEWKLLGSLAGRSGQVPFRIGAGVAVDRVQPATNALDPKGRGTGKKKRKGGGGLQQAPQKPQKE